MYTQTDENRVLLKAINHPDDLWSVPECSFYISIWTDRTERNMSDGIQHVRQTFRHPPPQSSSACVAKKHRERREHSCNICRAESSTHSSWKGSGLFGGSGRVWREWWGAWQRLRWRDAVASYQRGTTLTQFREKHLFQTTYCTHPSRLLCIPGVPYRGNVLSSLTRLMAIKTKLPESTEGMRAFVHTRDFVHSGGLYIHSPLPLCIKPCWLMWNILVFLKALSAFLFSFRFKLTVQACVWTQNLWASVMILQLHNISFVGRVASCSVGLSSAQSLSWDLHIADFTLPGPSSLSQWATCLK